MNVLVFICAFVVFYWWHMLGTTIGYHRLISHRSFKCNKLVEYFWVLGGYLGFEGSPLWWATVHRAHHRHTDSELDPHSPRYGWQNAYYGWIVDSSEYSEHIDPKKQSKDLIKDPIYRFLDAGGNSHRAHLLNCFLGFGFRIVLLFTCGWVIALASVTAGLIVQQVPLLLNVVCHIPKLGYKNYDTGDDSVNVWWVALLTAGEGWHNNHHAYPGSARSGIKPHEFDFSYLMLKIQQAFGLVQIPSETNFHRGRSVNISSPS
jgi:fatty-acid desaturase